MCKARTLFTRVGLHFDLKDFGAGYRFSHGGILSARIWWSAGSFHEQRLVIEPRNLAPKGIGWLESGE